LSREKAVYLGLLGLGVVALIADRMFFTPASAEASAGPVEAAPPSPGAIPAHTEPVEAASAGKPLSARLAQAVAAPWDSSNVPDAFHSGTSWIAESMMGPPLLESAEPRSENTPRTHKLMSISGIGDNVMAIIDHKPYQVGATLDDGLIVTAISREDGAVELRGSTGTITLSLRSRP
jgi:hypothetical protein